MENKCIVMQFVDVLRNNPSHAYDFIAINGHLMSKMELTDIIKELVYGIYDSVLDMEQNVLWGNVAEELADQYSEN